MKIGVLISGRGSNLQSLINAQFTGHLSAEIVTVISNVPGAGGLKRATKAGISSTVVNHKKFDRRNDFDETLNEALAFAGVDLICLAGFMCILGDEFVNEWKDRLINIHPSLLPSFKGLNTHERALEAGVRFSGCTIHFVRAAMDDGPIISQAVIPIQPDDTPQSLASRVLLLEHKTYPTAVRMIAEGRVRVKGNSVTIKDANFTIDPMINPTA